MSSIRSDIVVKVKKRDNSLQTFTFVKHATSTAECFKFFFVPEQDKRTPSSQLACDCLCLYCYCFRSPTTMEELEKCRYKICYGTTNLVKHLNSQHNLVASSKQQSVIGTSSNICVKKSEIVDIFVDNLTPLAQIESKSWQQLLGRQKIGLITLFIAMYINIFIF